MRRVIGPIALGLLITATGCVEGNGYPATYGYQPYAAPAYYGRPTAYSATYAAPVYAAPAPTRYVAVPVYGAPAYTARTVPPPHRHHRKRHDGDD